MVTSRDRYAASVATSAVAAVTAFLVVLLPITTSLPTLRPPGATFHSSFESVPFAPTHNAPRQKLPRGRESGMVVSAPSSSIRPNFSSSRSSWLQVKQARGRDHEHEDGVGVAGGGGGKKKEEDVVIFGLLDDETFRRNDAVHATLTNLRSQLPSTATIPLSLDSARLVYAENVTVVGPGGGEREVLCSGIDELVALSTTIAAAATAARRASDLLASATSAFLGGGGQERPSSSRQGKRQRPRTGRAEGSGDEDVGSGGTASSQPQDNGSSDFAGDNDDGTVQCELAVDHPDLSTVRVRWSTDLPGTGGGVGRIGGGPGRVLLGGTSDLHLDGDGKVDIHRLVDLTVDGQTLAPTGLGETLASLRTMVRDSPIARTVQEIAASRPLGRSVMESSPFSPFLSELRDNLLSTQASVVAAASDDDGQSSALPPLYVMTNSSISSAFNESLGTDGVSSAGSESPSNDTSPWNMRPIDAFVPRTNATFSKRSSTSNLPRSIPLPGSVAWEDYASAHVSISEFVDLGIPTLVTGEVPLVRPPPPHRRGDADAEAAGSDDEDKARSVTGGGGGVGIADIFDIFTSDAVLAGVDGSVLIDRDGRRMARLYRTLASSRRNVNGDWSLRQPTVPPSSPSPSGDDGDHATIGYSDANPPALSADWEKGEVTVRWESRSPGVHVDGVDRFVIVSVSPTGFRVERVEQVQLVVQGNEVRDSEWARAFIFAVEAGERSGAVGSGELLMELLSQASGGGKKPASESGAATDGPPRLTDRAAASVYGIMCALHRDYPRIVDLGGGPAGPSTPPAGQYLTKDVELRGLLGELLARGSTAYGRAVAVATASLRATLRTGSVHTDGPPVTTVEFTSGGNVGLSFVLRLRVETPSLTPSLPGGGTGGAGRSGRGVALKLELKSEYRLNKDGQILEHRLLESRVNDRLTPGDVVSRFITGLPNEPHEREDSPSAGLRAIWDVVLWARSISGG